MTVRTWIGFLAALALATAAPALAFTMAETGAAMGTADALGASSGLSASHARDVIMKRLKDAKGGVNVDPDRKQAGGFGAPCGTHASSSGPAKNWKRASEAPLHARTTVAWKNATTVTNRATRIAWAKATDPSRCH